jgi:prephenate dehydrogenase
LKNLGIIGYGHFGKFIATELDSYFIVKIFSENDIDIEHSASFNEVAQCDYVVLAVPISAYEEVCEKLKPILRPDTIIVDVCSVKEESSNIIKGVLPNQLLISIHPLFGPESAAGNLKDHVLVMCPDMTTENLLQPCQDFFEGLGLKVVKMPSSEHDQSMATVQGLTFFIARILESFDLQSSKLITPSFRRLVALAELEKHHTEELFVTIQNGNPYAEGVRRKFIERAQEIEAFLVKDKIL